jgi:hypothetical protein
VELAALAAVLGAFGGALKIVLDYIGKLDERRERAMAEQRAGFENFMGNHMSSSTRAQQDTERALRDLVAVVDELRQEVHDAGRRSS